MVMKGVMAVMDFGNNVHNGNLIRTILVNCLLTIISTYGCPINWDRSSYVFTEEGGDDIILGGLLDDLGWEFVGEHHRRQDLIRFRMQDGRNVFNGKSWFCKDATTETHWDYFPIPKSALDANLNLKQNEGYSSK